MSTATSKIKGWFQRQKDQSISLVAEKVLRTKLEPYGRLISVDLNSQQNQASLEILLNGEVEPVKLEVPRYELTHEGAGTCLVIREVRASREWLTALLRDFLVDRPLPIPEKYAGYFKLLL